MKSESMFKIAVERWTRFFLRRYKAPVNEGDIDRLIMMLENEDSECVIRKLEKLGEPALIRLFQVCEGIVKLPPCRDWRDGDTYRHLALGRLGKRYPERLLQLVQGRKYLRLGTIQGIGFTGDERLKAIATKSESMFKIAVERWTRFFLRRYKAPVNEGDIDRLIMMLEKEDSECVIRKLEKLGVPALIRLLQVCEGIGSVPASRYPQDAAMYRPLALGRLGKRYPERLLHLVQGRKYLKLGTIQGLGLTGDERLKTIARAALKVFGDDR